MKDSSYTKLLDRFMRGETSAEENQQLLRWFNSDESRAEIRSFYEKRWQEAMQGDAADSDVQERMYRQIKARMQTIAANEKTSPAPRRTMLHTCLRYAAVILLLIGIGLGSHMYIQRGIPPAREQKFNTSKGQRASIQLPDGTKVWLNSHTTLAYSTNYGTKERVVSLSGEAFFEVAHDKKHRFAVNANGMEVEALGTSFNVKAYHEDKTITTSLFTGRVKVSVGTKSAVLTEGQQASFNKGNGQLSIGRPESIAYANMWRDNELAFDGQTLGEIAILLNRMYNLEVCFESDKIKNYRFSGVIRNNSLDNIIEIISLTAPIAYRAEGDTIFLSARKDYK